MLWGRGEDSAGVRVLIRTRSSGSVQTVNGGDASGRTQGTGRPITPFLPSFTGLVLPPGPEGVVGESPRGIDRPVVRSCIRCVKGTHSEGHPPPVSQVLPDSPALSPVLPPARTSPSPPLPSPSSPLPPFPPHPHSSDPLSTILINKYTNVYYLTLSPALPSTTIPWSSRPFPP